MYSVGRHGHDNSKNWKQMTWLKEFSFNLYKYKHHVNVYFLIPTQKRYKGLEWKGTKVSNYPMKLLSTMYILYCVAAENPKVKDIFCLLYLPSGGKERGVKK